MSKDEMRLCRREIISFTLLEILEGSVIYMRLYPSEKLSFTKQFVREYEVTHYGAELKAYL
jgi:hypothetical protein